jgi:uncharacterized protein
MPPHLPLNAGKRPIAIGGCFIRACFLVPGVPNIQPGTYSNPPKRVLSFYCYLIKLLKIRRSPPFGIDSLFVKKSGRLREQKKYRLQMKSKLRYLLIGIGSFLFLVLIWGVLIEPRMIDQVHCIAKIPGLPSQWESKKIAFIADMQIGMWFDNEQTVMRIIEQIIREDPALVLIGGDFIYHPTEEETTIEALEEFDKEEVAKTRAVIKKVVDMVSPIVDSGLPVYAVFGNHDYAMETQNSLKLAWVAEELESALTMAGIQVLNNEAIELEGKGVSNHQNNEPLYLIGIGAFYPSENNVAKAFSGLSHTAPRIVLMHNPQSFKEIPAGQAPLCLAGHTHGGQIRIPYLRSWSWISIVKEREVHTDGWIQNFGEPGNHLYVNRGIGFSLVPIRINCPSEITYLTLTRD